MFDSDLTLNIEGLTMAEIGQILTEVRRLDVDPQRNIIASIGARTLSIDEAEGAIIDILPETPNRVTVLKVVRSTHDNDD